MSELVDDLQRIAAASEEIAKRIDSEMEEALTRIEKTAMNAGKAFCGSWLGYHSRVYYSELQAPPPGAHFSPEWGLKADFVRDTVGQWVEYSYDTLFEHFVASAGTPTLEDAEAVSRDSAQEARELREELLSVLAVVEPSAPGTYVEELQAKAKEAKGISASSLVKHLQPTGEIFSRDNVAILNGVQTPPHIAVLCQIQAIRSQFSVGETLSLVARRAARHLWHLEKAPAKRSVPTGNKIFIGHGRSSAWRDLKDFLQDRLGLPWDEFNRVPVAGLTNIARLSEMLDVAAVAFLVMTAEDERADGQTQARMNVVHEAGLFQGRLGFTRAIVLLEDGCQEFSNIQGLGQIRFPAGEIRASFEEVRKVLERERIVTDDV